jgi:hypothetical protein
VHDQVALEEGGVPAVFVATTEFRGAAEHQARALGAEPEAVYVPHPVQDRSDDEMRAMADAAVEALLARLLGS